MVVQSLRRVRVIARWMLVWFALSIGVAVAAPMVHPQALTLICTTAGSVKFVAESSSDKASDGVSGVEAHSLDCVMCLSLGTLPHGSWQSFEPELTSSLQPALIEVYLPAHYLSAFTARGPPIQL